MADEDTTRVVTRKSTQDLGDTVITSGLEHRTITSNKDPETKIFRPASSSINSTADKLNKEPVVGWLVVVDGPGKGQSLQLGYGMNTIGRASDERVSLDFGDEEISRNSHAMLTYDGKNRKFYLQHGGGVNLTYLGESPVLQPHELVGRELISIGNTRLIFVPFCGEVFDWQ